MLSRLPPSKMTVVFLFPKYLWYLDNPEIESPKGFVALSGEEIAVTIGKVDEVVEIRSLSTTSLRAALS